MSDSRTLRILNYAQAVREALYQSMERRPEVIVIGEGVPDPKGIFGTTSGLREAFGANRVFDMPIAENGMTGICIGAALSGMRPVMVHQRIDFALLAMDQLVNNAAKWRYMFNGQGCVPLVVRMLIGRGWGQGPQHSQSLQAMFAQVPGLRVVMPATARDAKGMLISAIDSDDPVIFIEHRWLHHIEDEVSGEDAGLPLEGARVLRRGGGVTIAAFSYMVLESLAAADALKSVLGLDVEVLDMRSVRPLDVEAVVRSLHDTGRLIVADTAHSTGSIAGELIARVVEQDVGVLRKPPVRVASPDYPTPTAPSMTKEYYPDAGSIVCAVLSLLDMKPTCDQDAALRKALARDRPHDTPNLAFTGPF